MDTEKELLESLISALVGRSAALADKDGLESDRYFDYSSDAASILNSLLLKYPNALEADTKKTLFSELEGFLDTIYYMNEEAGTLDEVAQDIIVANSKEG